MLITVVFFPVAFLAKVLTCWSFWTVATYCQRWTVLASGSCEAGKATTVGNKVKICFLHCGILSHKALDGLLGKNPMSSKYVD